jgi:dolichyl-phosphate-mannose--protein O-mannosyl transferase
MPKDRSYEIRSSDAWVNGVTQLLLIALIIGGVVARVHDFGYPNELTWDEPHFVENARNLLAGRSDWNDHPPLGKLLIALGVLVVGDEGTGWRLAPLLFGLALIALAYALGGSAFGSRLAGLYAGAFLAASGFVLAFSKTALLDGMLATSMVAAALALWRARSWRGFTLGAVFIGLSMSIKFTGVVLVVPLALLTFRRLGINAKTFAVFVLGVVAMAAIYVAQFSLGLALAGEEHGVVDVAANTAELFRHHIGLDDWKHPSTSRWYTWFIPLNTVRLHYAREGDVVRMMTTFGNPILWWGVNAAVLWTGFDVLRRLRQGLSAAPGDASTAASGQRYLLLLWFLPLCPWIFTNRDSYIYHYLPSYVFGIILFGGLASTLSRPKARLALVATVTVVFVFGVRLWSKIPLDADSLVHSLFFR